MIGDHYQKKWGDTWPGAVPLVSPSKQEFDLLKKEVQEMKELLKRAIKYDRDNNQPDCPSDEKIAFLKKIAEFVGINIDEVFK